MDPEELKDAIEKMVQYGQEMVNNHNSLIDRIDDIFFSNPITELIAKTVEDSLNSIRQLLGELINLLRDALQHATPVISMVRQADVWLQQVRTPMSNIAGAVTDPADMRLYGWEGQTSSEYSGVAERQSQAAATVSKRAAFISGWLVGIANTNLEYVQQLGDVLAAVSGKLAAAVVEAGTLIGAVFSIQDLAGVVGTLVESAINELTGILDKLGDRLVEINKLDQERTDQQHLPDGAWPEAIRG